MKKAVTALPAGAVHIAALTIAAMCTLGLARISHAGEGGVRWSYAGETGPEDWGELAEEFAAQRS